MNSRLSAIIASFLMLVVFIPFGVSISLQCLEWIAKLEMKEKLEHSRLHTVELPLHGFQWYESESEVLINQRLFDVKSYYITSNTIYLTGLFDEEETKLKEEVAAMQKNREEEENSENFADFFLYGTSSEFSLRTPASISPHYIQAACNDYSGPARNTPYTPPDYSL